MLELFWWGSIQLVFGGAALGVAVVAAVVVPASRQPGLPLDAVGGLLSLVGLAGLVFGIIEGGERGWDDSVTVSALAVGVVALLGFVVHVPGFGFGLAATPATVLMGSQPRSKVRP
jgi:hypothetical protein